MPKAEMGALGRQAGFNGDVRQIGKDHLLRIADPVSRRADH